MAIKRPQPELLRNIPLKFVRARVSGHGRKDVDHQIPLIPFIDFLIVSRDLPAHVVLCFG